MSKSPAELIAEIKLLQDELEKLGVRRERIVFHRLGTEQLENELDAVSDQLETRKRFLGVK